MSNAQLSSLAAKHADLEARISVEVSRPNPDNIVLAMLKKQKLRLKELMTRR